MDIIKTAKTAAITAATKPKKLENPTPDELISTFRKYLTINYYENALEFLKLNEDYVKANINCQDANGETLLIVIIKNCPNKWAHK